MVDLTDLTPATSEALARLKAGLAAQGYNVGDPISAYRTYADQQQLYANYLAGKGGQSLPYPDRGAVALAARPGYSPHEFGVAFDLGLHGAALDAANRLAPGLGLATVAGDPGHYQLASWHGATSPAVQVANAQPAAQPAASAFAMPNNAPMGMRNNNPLNIKYVPGAPYAGLVGPSKNTDQGDPQMVFSSPEAGWSAAYQLLSRKYGSGMTTPAAIIAGQGGWTPGNMQAAGNVAKSAGIGVNDDIGFNDPAKAAKFMRALVTQEQGGAGGAYPDAMIANAISGKWTPSTSAPASSGGAAPPGTSLTSVPAGAAGGVLPGFGTKQASDQFLAGLKQAGITPNTGDQPSQQPDIRPSPIMGGPGLRNSPGLAGVEAAARQLDPQLTHYSPGLYGQSLNSQPLAWGGSPLPAPSWLTAGAQQPAAQGYGTNLNSLQMAGGLSPYQLQMLMNPMMLDQGG